ncbi:MAG: DUF4328 domain-containing protein [Maribacter sp.]
MDMTREEQLFFCKKCTHRDFHLTEGILCKLTGAKANFEETCPSYKLDKEKINSIQPSEAVRPNLQRAIWAQNLIWVVLFIQLLSITSSYLQYNLLQDLNAEIFVSDEDLDMNDMREGLIALLYLVVYIASGIVFIQWFRRAYFNLSLRTRCDYNEGWAAGGWFVPILSLFRPYQIMNELQEKTVGLVNKRSQQSLENKSGPILGLWWALWIISNFIGQFALKAAFKADTIETLTNSTIADMILGAIDIPMGILVVMLIKSWMTKEELLLDLERKESQFLV